jgi:hypothetical protein
MSRITQDCCRIEMGEMPAFLEISSPITLSALIRQISNMTRQELKSFALSNVDTNILWRVELNMIDIRVGAFRGNSYYDMNLHYSLRELVSHLLRPCSRNLHL